MFQESLSQQQLSNILSAAGVVVLILQRFGVVLSTDEVAFVFAAVWTLGWKAYGYYDRYKKGDVSVFGVRKTRSA